jgi:16S rRNA (cytidine1402-2'-O)-methyltransferase
MSQETKKGILYLVSTPIGNLEDITLRALRTLKEVDLIACEDTRHTRNLLAHYGIGTPLTSLRDENEQKKGEVLVEALLDGRSLAYVSDAGTPLISDPGYRLVRIALEQGVSVVPIPGPSAVIAALSVSGMPSDRFAFFGFLPEKEGRRRSFLRQVAALPMTLVFYESPRRLIASLKDIRDILGDRRVAVARELTKVFEEVDRAPVSEVLRKWDGMTVRGEITLLVEGAPERNAAGDKEIEALYREMSGAGGASTRDLAGRISVELDLPKKKVYDAVLKLRAGEQESGEKG